MKRLLAALLWLLLAAVAWAQQGLQPIPPLTALAVDQTGTLDPIQLKGLDDKLKAFEREKGTQIAVLIVPTTLPEDDASYANRVGNAWKIGRKGVGDGVLVLVAKNDRKIRIEVAKTLEGAIPDLAAKQIIDEAIRPAFRNDDYLGGLQAGTDRLIARIKGEALPAPKAAPGAQKPVAMGFDWMDLAIFLFIGVPVLGGILRGIFGRKFGSLLTGAGAGTAALLVTSSLFIAGVAAFIALVYTLLTGGLGAMASRRGGGFGGGPWIGGGGFGGGGGGGFGGGGGGGWGGSGGGGDFGGGGASGDW